MPASSAMSLPDWLFYGVPALIYLLLTLWALFNVLGSASRPAQKVLWVALLVLFRCSACLTGCGSARAAPQPARLDDQLPPCGTPLRWWR